ncbi:MAG: 16S rRNA (guanine1516-N2)-methyltransferase [Phycisphaerales bacterium]|jgi:16S rRNA (guanine1516-N2)-methyltransferase
MSSTDTRQSSVQHPQRVAVVVETDNARLIKESKNILQHIKTTTQPGDVTLLFGERGIELHSSNQTHKKGQRVDFLPIVHGVRTLSKKQPLPKAIGPYTSVVDATAGFGMDACRLALLGFNVTAIEQSPIVSAMLRDGIWRAMEHSTAKKLLQDNLRFVESNAIDYMNNHNPEVVYIDPMFPPKKKKSALPPGHIQMLQAVVGFDDAEATNSLFQTALRSATKRIVVKRPTEAPCAGENPIVLYKSKLVRYEVYAPFSK